MIPRNDLLIGAEVGIGVATHCVSLSGNGWQGHRRSAELGAQCGAGVLDGTRTEQPRIVVLWNRIPVE
jgi:hypothetical protein